MSEKPEALRLAENLVNQWWGMTASPSGLPEVSPVAVATLRVEAARLLREQHAEIEVLWEALAWAYNLRHLRGHSDPVVIPERFAPFIEAALRREDKT